jgi:hypothetical protein
VPAVGGLGDTIFQKGNLLWVGALLAAAAAGIVSFSVIRRRRHARASA